MCQHFTCVLHVLVYSIPKLYFKCNLWDLISILKLNMIPIIIFFFFLHEDLDYNQMYTFVFNHDHKIEPFFTVKDV